MDQGEQKVLDQIGAIMSAISEACVDATWLGGTERFVPELCRRALVTGEPQPWGRGEVTPEQALELLELVEQIGHWADLAPDGVGYVPFDPYPMSREYPDELDRDLQKEGQDD